MLLYTWRTAHTLSTPHQSSYVASDVSPMAYRKEVDTCLLDLDAYVRETSIEEIRPGDCFVAVWASSRYRAVLAEVKDERQVEAPEGYFTSEQDLF